MPQQEFRWPQGNYQSRIAVVVVVVVDSDSVKFFLAQHMSLSTSPCWCLDSGESSFYSNSINNCNRFIFTFEDVVVAIILLVPQTLLIGRLRRGFVHIKKTCFLRASVLTGVEDSPFVLGITR